MDGNHRCLYKVQRQINSGMWLTTQLTDSLTGVILCTYDGIPKLEQNIGTCMRLWFTFHVCVHNSWIEVNNYFKINFRVKNCLSFISTNWHWHVSLVLSRQAFVTESIIQEAHCFTFSAAAHYERKNKIIQILL